MPAAKVSTEEFIAIWNAQGGNPSGVALKTGIKPKACSVRASRLRKDGYQLIRYAKKCRQTVTLIAGDVAANDHLGIDSLFHVRGDAQLADARKWRSLCNKRWRSDARNINPMKVNLDRDRDAWCPICAAKLADWQTMQAAMAKLSRR